MAGSERREDIHRLLVDSVRDYAIFALDPSGVVITWNPGAEALKGYRASEIIGRHFSTFYPDEDVARGKPADELRIASEYGRYEDEGWRVRKDGSRFWANVVITAIRAPGSTELRGFSKVTRDLTERRQSEEALRQSEEKFRLLVDGVADYSIVMLDEDGRLQSWNSGARRLTGHRPTEVVGHPVSLFYLPSEREAGLPQRDLEQAAREGRLETEGWRVRKDGTRFWANITITPLADPLTGRRFGFSQVTRDLTRSKAAERALVAAYDAMEAFSYTASHDLRAPLRAMQTLADLTLRDSSGGMGSDARENLARIRASAERASRLVEDLLEFARVGRVDLHAEDVDVGELAAKAIEDLRQRDPGRRVDFHVVSPDEVSVRGDPSLLRVVVENLMSNAWKYTQKTVDARIELGALPLEDGRRTVYVRDNGVGFPPDRAKDLFQPFHRLHGPSEFAGTGIGLATVRRIVERHGGEAWAEGRPGEGATFYLSLPPA